MSENDSPAVQMVRLFFGVSPGEEARAQLAEALEKVRADHPEWKREVRWTRPENLHCTLKFLGDTAEDIIPAVVEAARQAISADSVFFCRLAGTSLFEAAGRSGIIHAAVDEEEPFSRMAGELDAALEKMGYRPEKRRFRAHITLGRSRTLRIGEAARRALSEMALDAPVVVRSVELFRSHLGAGPPVYTPLASLPLKEK